MHAACGAACARSADRQPRCPTALLSLSATLLCLVSFATLPASADRLIFGSFKSPENAANWASKLSQSFAHDIVVVAVGGASENTQENPPWHRVVSGELNASEFTDLSHRARAAGVQHWRWITDNKAVDRLVDRPAQKGQSSTDRIVRLPGNPQITTPRLTPPSPVLNPIAPAPVPETSSEFVPQTLAEQGVDDGTLSSTESKEGGTNTDASVTGSPRLGDLSDVTQSWEWDLGMQARLFAHEGVTQDSQLQGSVSAQLEYFRGWNNDQQSITFAPFVRIDSLDGRRTHADIRELFYSSVQDDWDIHIGARRVFWGVTEFHHLIDVVNQTDLVENLDTEDKLGQPMVQLSLVRDWGLLDVFVLTGFRERTFADGGFDGQGRMNLPWHMRDAAYESGAEEKRTDFAVRWSHNLGPFEVGVHHFSGTSREPILLPHINFSQPALSAYTPFYPVIDQTGIDAQAISGHWAFKLEGFSKSGFGDRYTAANLGVERTLTGLLGTDADFGIVAEYMFDDRDDAAFNTLFEHDIALGGRLALNDAADTTALVGIIYDPSYRETVVSIEASRQLGNSWSMNVEGRFFSGGRSFPLGSSPAVLLNDEFKSSLLQEEDYLQIEFKKYL